MTLRRGELEDETDVCLRPCAMSSAVKENKKRNALNLKLKTWHHTLSAPSTMPVPYYLVFLQTYFFEIDIFPKFPVNVLILVLLAVAFLIIVQRNLLNLSDFLHREKPGMFPFCDMESQECVGCTICIAIYSRLQ